MRSFNLIVSCAENRVMGRAGRLPWSIPEDQEFFHRKTEGQIVVLGRVCFDTWPAALTGGRRAIVLTSDPVPAPAAASRSLADALRLAGALPGEIYICGGQQIYEEAIARPEAERLYLTLVHAQVAGDRFFPDWTPFFTREVARRESADAKWRYTFLTLER